MNREQFYTMMRGPGTTDYELFVNTAQLLACQKDYSEVHSPDELQFQMVHQVAELWMKLVAYTLLDVDDCLRAAETNRALTLMERVHRVLRLMIDELSLLETMSPKEYQTIRQHLGNGSGQESPGFQTLLKMHRPLWRTFKRVYLDRRGLTVAMIYDTHYTHCESYMVAEALTEYDELFQIFRARHVHLIARTIGRGARSLKGRAVKVLNRGLRMKFFPELWAIRDRMTDAWGKRYGVVRESLPTP